MTSGARCPAYDSSLFEVLLAERIIPTGIMGRYLAFVETDQANGQ